MSLRVRRLNIKTYLSYLHSSHIKIQQHSSGEEQQSVEHKEKGGKVGKFDDGEHTHTTYGYGKREDHHQREITIKFCCIKGILCTDERTVICVSPKL